MPKATPKLVQGPPLHHRPEADHFVINILQMLNGFRFACEFTTAFRASPNVLGDGTARDRISFTGMLAAAANTSVKFLDLFHTECRRSTPKKFRYA